MTDRYQLHCGDAFSWLDTLPSKSVDLIITDPPYESLEKHRAERSDEAARIAATIEHNRARGEHQIDQMSEIVRMLHRAGWRDEKIQEELGMDPDEVRRLKQLTGLAELFASREYSEAWEPAE